MIYKEDIVELLADVMAFLDNYSDVIDGEGGQPLPNAAMSLWQRVEEAYAQLQGTEQ